MKRKPATLSIVAVALTVALSFVAVASASTTSQIIQDAADGTLNGHYTAAQVRAALAAVKANPVYSQYSDVASVLKAYLSSFSTPASSSPTPSTAPSTSGTSTTSTAAGQLDYTGGQPFLVLALGGGLIITGLVLRWRRT
jgi:hypothetical protein